MVGTGRRPERGLRAEARGGEPNSGAAGSRSCARAWGRGEVFFLYSGSYVDSHKSML